MHQNEYEEEHFYCAGDCALEENAQRGFEVWFWNSLVQSGSIFRILNIFIFCHSLIFLGEICHLFAPLLSSFYHPLRLNQSWYCVLLSDAVLWVCVKIYYLDMNSTIFHQMSTATRVRYSSCIEMLKAHLVRTNRKTLCKFSNIS